MRRMTLMLVGLVLMSGASLGPAMAEEYNHGSAALANDAGLSLEGLRRHQALLYDLPEASADVAPEAGDGHKGQGLLACHLIDGCGYTINSQVMIDLQYHIASPELAEAAFAGNDVAGDRFAPNLMLGFRYHF